MRYSGVVNCFNTVAVLLLFTMAQQKIAAAPCPCDIYAAGGTPCVAAHSVVRALFESYNGHLYQVRRASDNQTRDIFPVTAGGFANAAAQDSFLQGTTGKFSIIYDQSADTSHNNYLKKAPAGGYVPRPDSESSATAGKETINGHPVYALYMKPGEGYRNDTTKKVATGTNPEGMYWVVNGKRYNSGCCWDYGNCTTNNTAKGTGTMECLYFGSWCWFKPCQGSGPWIFADLEGGLFSQGSGTGHNDTSLNYNYVTGMLKGNASTFTLRDGNAQSGTLITTWNGARPSPNHLEGAILLGIGGDNSNSGLGTFYEGAMTSGRPSDTTEDAVQRNLVVTYGTTGTNGSGAKEVAPIAPCVVRYDQSNVNAVISYALQDARHVSMNIFDTRGRHIAAIVNGVIPAGRHEAVWNARRASAGIYIWRIAIDGRSGGTGRICIGK